MRDRRLATSENSAATNTPLIATSAMTATTGRITSVTRLAASTIMFVLQ